MEEEKKEEREPSPEPKEPKSPGKTAKKGKKGAKEEVAGPTEEEIIAMEAAEAERKKYGRNWIWEGFFNDKLKDTWNQTADMLGEINPHVL